MAEQLKSREGVPGKELAWALGFIALAIVGVELLEGV